VTLTQRSIFLEVVQNLIPKKEPAERKKDVKTAGKPLPMGSARL
jgi:hypothetical protein